MDNGRLAILMTNIQLVTRTGTEVATLDLACALREAGHRVAVYSPRLGPLAREMMARGVPVTNRIERIGFVPDVIHASHNIAALPAWIRFRSVPSIMVCHDSSSPADAPVLLARVGVYVAIDAACFERLIVDGVPAARIQSIPNGVALGGIRLRPLRTGPAGRALAVVKASTNWIEPVAAACRAAGLALDVVGPGVERTVDDLPERIERADIVFAHSRSAAEAAASGAAVVICDERGFGGLLTEEEARRFPDSPLGRRVLPEPVTVTAVTDAIAAYDPEHARAVAEIVRRRLTLDGMRVAYVQAYRRAMAAAAPSKSEVAGDDAELAAFAAACVACTDEPAATRRREDLVRREASVTAWFDANAAALFGHPQRLAFGSEAPDLIRLLRVRGWSYPEAWGTWSDGPLAVLRIPRDLARLWGGVRIRCHHAFPTARDDGTVRRVEVRVDGGSPDVWTFRHPGSAGIREMTLRFPDPTDGVHITFRLPDRLEDGDAASGQRQLGLGISAIASPA